MTSMLSLLLWYLTLTLLGWLVFPLVYRLLPGLPDRGYAFSRSLGLLLWGFAFWFLGSLGVLANNRGGICLAFALVLLLSVLAAGKDLAGYWRSDLGNWLAYQRGYLLVIEGLFLIAFASIALIRAANPEIIGTEKPMELAFINAILHSPNFPPHDPWLSGYAISYYYFGYVLVALLAKFTATPGSVAFNLGLSTVFALGAIGVYGLVYNMLAKWSWDRNKNETDLAHSRRTLLIYPLLGVLFVLLIGNLDGLLEVMHARGLFWPVEPVAAESISSPFWQWLDIKDLDQPPSLPYKTAPTRYLWWWRASRVVQDYNYSGGPLELIDEMPSFSFILGDLHPHVLAMPFAILVIALALNLYLGGGRGKISLAKWGSSSLTLHLNLPSFLLAVVVLGGMAFLNTWDFPIYVALFAGAYTLHRVREAPVENNPGWSMERLQDFIVLGMALGIGGIICYLPFYFGFSSQAGGILPNLIFPTRGAHLWVMFALLVIPIGVYLLYLGRRYRNLSAPGVTRYRPLLLALGVMLFLWLFSLALGWIITSIPGVSEFYMNFLAVPDKTALFQEALYLRLMNSGGWITLLALLALVLGLLVKTSPVMEAENESPPEAALPLPLSHSFSLLLILLGILLVLGPEFAYLRDQFGWRINTIFKFYYQAWLVWGVAAAYATAVLLESLNRRWDLVWRLATTAILCVGLIYPVFGFWTKTTGFRPPAGWTLDGAAFLESQTPDEMAAIRWLENAPQGVVVEAVGGSYTSYARVATFSGQPNVLGWPGHENQWRGGVREMGNRESDIERLYRSSHGEELLLLLAQYNIRYVFLGDLERSTYGAKEERFAPALNLVFEQGNVKIYEAPLSAPLP